RSRTRSISRSAVSDRGRAARLRRSTFLRRSRSARERFFSSTGRTPRRRSSAKSCRRLREPRRTITRSASPTRSGAAQPARGSAQEFESIDRVAQEIQNLWTMGLPMTELQRAPAEWTKATREAVNGAAGKYAAPRTSTLLLVGDLGKIETGVRELGLGEVV